MSATIDARIMAEHTPDGLSDMELELDRYPLTRPPKPVPVRAWVHYDGIPLRLAVEMVAWTPKAVAIRWTTPQGREDKIWAWASSCDDSTPAPLRQH